jgi:hypothetical protein
MTRKRMAPEEVFAIRECEGFAVASVWRRERRKNYPGRIFCIADLAIRVEEDLNCAFEDYIPLSDDSMTYVQAELRERCQRARGIKWSDALVLSTPAVGKRGERHD